MAERNCLHGPVVTTLCSAPHFAQVHVHHTLTLCKMLEAMLTSMEVHLNVWLHILLNRNLGWIEVVGTKSAFTLICCHSPHPQGLHPQQSRCPLLRGSSAGCWRLG